MGPSSREPRIRMRVEDILKFVFKFEYRQGHILGVMTERPTALVTGASRGVGEAVARALGPTHHVMLGGRDEAALAKLAAGLPDARPWPVELTRLTEADVAGVERLDVLVHSAGIL